MNTNTTENTVETQDPVAAKAAEIIEMLRAECANEIQTIEGARQEMHDLETRRARHAAAVKDAEQRVEQARGRLDAAVAADNQEAISAADDELQTAERLLASSRRVLAAVPDVQDARVRVTLRQKALANKVRQLIDLRNVEAGDRVVEMLHDLASAYMTYTKAVQQATGAFSEHLGSESIAARPVPNLRLGRFRDGHPMHEFAEALTGRNLAWLVDGVGLTK